MDNFIEKVRIKAYDTLNDTVNYLIKKYKTNVRNFTYASPFGQIVLVLQNISQNIFYYIQDAATQSNFQTATRQHAVFGLARLQGHNAYRGKSATGEITLRLKPNVTESQINGDKIYIPNYARIQNIENGLNYVINFSKEFEIFNINSLKQISIPIIEGKLESQIFTGTGEDLQTYECAASQWQMFDHDFVFVTVNGKVYEQYDSLYDIPYKTAGCLVKTGMTSGIDIIFGKDVNAEIPKLGEEIRVDYLVTSGSVGNIIGDSPTYKFIDTCFDTLGNEVSMDDIFYIEPKISPSFGADAESMELTKILAPNISRNFLIHDRRSIDYFFRRMNYFSVIKIFKRAVNNINEYSVILVPKITNRLNTGENYFNMSEEKFLLTKQEQTKLLNQIHESGNKSANITINLTDPIIKKFAMFIFLEVFEEVNNVSVNVDTLKETIKSKLSDYLLNNSRISKIPHSDIVALLDGIEGVDTVKVIFSSEDGNGIDSLGNINVADTEMAVIRGGWKDKVNGIDILDSYDPEGDEIGSVNIDITMV